MERIIEEIKKYAAPGRYVVGLSGGADSVALTAACFRLQQQDFRYEFMAGHVNHGLRGEEAKRDAKFAEQFCQKLGMPYRILQVDVEGRRKISGESLEEAARKLRYRALTLLGGEFCAKRILTAHHGKDQAETVLLRLLRGAGIRGLGAMHRDNGFVIRPLLSFGKEELENICRENNLPWVEDSSNDDLHFTRNYLRKEVFPMLAKLNPNLTENLVRTARYMQEDEAALSLWAEKIGAQRIKGEELGTMDWSLLPAAVRKRIIRSWLEKLRCKAGGIHIDSVDKLILTGTSNKVLALPGLTVRYAYHKLVVDREKRHTRN